MAEVAADDLLILILDWAEDGLIVADLTLMVDGVVVCGTPATYREYFDLIGNGFFQGLVASAGAESAEAAGRIRGLFSDFGMQAREAWERTQEELTRILEELGNAPTDEERQAAREGFAKRERTYIHLKNVTVYGLTPKPVEQDAWRGRLSRVSGWHLGRWQTG